MVNCQRSILVMKVFLALIVVLTCLFSIFRNFSWAEEPAMFRLGVSTESFGGLNRNDTAAALRAWSEGIIKEKKMNLLAQLTVYDQLESLDGAYRNNELDALTLNVEEIMQLNVSPENVILPVIENELFVRYAIVVQENSGIQTPKDLIGKKMSSHETPRMLLARPWLETVVAEDLGKFVDLHAAPHKILFSGVENPSKAIFQVYFHQSSAALVTVGAFELACELNPQLRKGLKVISISQQFIHSVFLFRPTYKGDYKLKLENAITDMSDSPSGRQLLIAFQCSRMEQHPVSILDSTKQFLMKYQQIRHKPGA